MPSIQTLVADLNNGSIVGIGAKPMSNETNLSNTLSDTCRVKNLFVHMKASISATNRLACAGAAASHDFNGSYIHFQDDWSTVGTMDINRKIVASGNFSGCAYKIYRSAAAVYKCVHIARPSGAGADALVNLMASYAQQQGWVELQHVTTHGGLINGPNGCKEIFIVSQLFPNQRIDTVRLQINNQGLIVGRDLYSVTPI
jgi:hypothetical protein